MTDRDAQPFKCVQQIANPKSSSVRNTITQQNAVQSKPNTFTTDYCCHCVCLLHSQQKSCHIARQQITRQVYSYRLFSGPDTAVSPVCVSVCVCVRTITVQRNDLSYTWHVVHHYPIQVKFVGQGHRSKFKVKGEKRSFFG